MDIHQTFSGGIFSESIEGGRASAQIQLTREGITATANSGEQFLLPYRECKIEIGGASDRMVFCRNADRSLTIYCEERAFSKTLADASMGLLDQQIKQRQLLQRKEIWSGRGWLVAFLAGSVLLLVVGYYGVRAAGQAAARALPISVDKQIGDLAYKHIDVGGPEVHDPVVKEAIQKMVDRLAPHAAIKGLKFDVHVFQSPMVNAFALPGGKIVVFTGLIEKAESPEQVAGVLGHEMAHATLRHGLERFGQSLGMATAVTLLIGNTEGVIAAGAQLFQLASVNSYGREQESAADAEGVRMLNAAGIDPSGLPKFFETLKHEEGDIPDAMAWISTHPQHEDRIKALEKLISSLPACVPVPLELDWSDIQKRVGKDVSKK
ncbi:MAG: M48 family metallopeptidase [Pirellulaceae bacterium]|nr:M48 family metallopeptidase [Pirellulaceae bacterium]